MKKLFLIPLFIFAIKAQAQATKQNYNFSLEQAISHALINNRSEINAEEILKLLKRKNGKLQQWGCRK